GVHEGMHAAWVESALRGKWLSVDASTAYGPLREYALAAWTALTGPTMEHLRLGMVAANLVGLLFAFAAGARLARGRASLLGLFAFAVVMLSPARFLVDYEHRISLGWVDLNRVALPLASVVFAMPHLAEDRAPRGRSIAAWGALAGAALLYSQ